MSFTELGTAYFIDLKLEKKMKQNEIFYQKLYFILYTLYLVHTTMH